MSKRKRILSDEDWKKWLDSISEKNPKTGNIQSINVPELGKIVSTWNFNKTLKKELGITRQEWVNMHKYGDINYTPICPFCGVNQLKFNIWDYRESCCEKECKSKWLSDQFKTNEEFSTKWKDSHKKGVASEEYRKKRSEISKSIARGMKENSYGLFSPEVIEYNKSDEKRDLCRRITTELWKNENFREIQSDSHKRFWENDENAERASANLSSNWNKSKKSKIFSEYENSDIKFDSSWERSFFILMSKDPGIKMIKRKRIRMIKYFSSKKNKVCRYRADFIIEYNDGHIELIEIKPAYLVESDITVTEKKLAAEEYCKSKGYTYRLLTEYDLIPMGVLDDKCNPIYK